jgi:hypothetical protein
MNASWGVCGDTFTFPAASIGDECPRFVNNDIEFLIAKGNR